MIFDELVETGTILFPFELVNLNSIRTVLLLAGTLFCDVKLI